MRFHCFVSVTAFVLVGVAFAGCGSETTTEPPGGAGADAAPDALEAAAPKQCTLGGGTCVSAFPDSTVPGFTVTCPSGYALADGTSTMTSGGNDIIHSSLAMGCSTNPDGTGTPALCCFPPDAGSGDAATEQ